MRCFKNEAQNRPLCEFRREKTPVFKRPWGLLTSLCVAAREFLSFGSSRHKCSPKESPPASLIGREKKTQTRVHRAAAFREERARRVAGTLV